MNERQYTNLFSYLLKKKNWNFLHSNKREDMHDHIDGFIILQNKGKAVRSLSVDLKGVKYFTKKDYGDKSKICQFIEFLNVNGDKGWLFGKAEVIAILNEEKNGFYLIYRKELLKWAENKFNIQLENRKIDDIEKDLLNKKYLWGFDYHKLIRRNGSKDIVTRIKISLIKELSFITI